MVLKSRQSRLLVLIVVGLMGIGFGIAYLYYRNLNKAEDPRVIPARRLLSSYDQLMKQGRFLEVFPLLDTVESIYYRTTGYERSYEFGVIENNRASAFIMRALYDTLLMKGEKDRLLHFAKEHLYSGIRIYEHWLDSTAGMDEPAIRSLIESIYMAPSCDLQDANREDVIVKRLKDIEFAKIETRRRLSVSYTNLGIVQRHLLMPDSAVFSYVHALKLWDDNHQARSNLDVLLGKEPAKRNFIQKLFPPDRYDPD